MHTEGKTLHPVDMPTIRYDAVAPGRPFHAVLTASRTPVREHGHDFWEAMLVVEGGGRHLRGSQTSRLAPGSIALLGPEDRHAIMPDPGGMAWVNVAFPDVLWRAFRAMAGDVGADTLRSTRAPFDRIVHAFRAGEDGRALVAFFAEAFAPGEAEAGSWLERALSADLVNGGVAAMREAACVSASHLARAVRAATGRSPTEIVVAHRLERADGLLATTTTPIAEIALDCGFANLSYFYRAYHRRYGRTPLDARRRAQRPLAPPSGGTNPHIYTSLAG